MRKSERAAAVFLKMFKRNSGWAFALQMSPVAVEGFALQCIGAPDRQRTLCFKEPTTRKRE